MKSPKITVCLLLTCCAAMLCFGEKSVDGPPSPNVICPDLTTCPVHNTCCLVRGPRYGCCPSPAANCCRDLQTCCAHGWRCVEERSECSPIRRVNVNIPATNLTTCLDEKIYFVP